MGPLGDNFSILLQDFGQKGLDVDSSSKFVWIKPVEIRVVLIANKAVSRQIPRVHTELRTIQLKPHIVCQLCPQR